MSVYNPKNPYNYLPDLPPEIDLETKSILRKVISASRSLSELKGAITNLPNPLLFIDSINLQEAQASSAIENIVTTQDALFQASVADLKVENSATKEVIHYKNALWYGVEEIKKRPLLTTNLFVSIVQIIKKNQSGIRNLPGTQLKNPITDEVIYSPPEGEEVIREKLRAFENFVNEESELDPLIKMALMHYQFEAIHPFFDGNGRTGRIILLLFLKHAGLMDLPALYLSSYILKHKDQYYIKLRNVTERNEWESWILYMLDMVEQTAKSARNQIKRIETLMVKIGEEIQTALPKIYSKDLLEIIFKLPYTKRSFLVNAGIGNIKTSGNYLKNLEIKGFLEARVVGKEKLYLNHRLMEILKSEN